MNPVVEKEEFTQIVYSMELRTIKQHEEMARRKLTEPFFRYYALSSGEGLTLRDSEQAFKR